MGIFLTVLTLFTLSVFNTATAFTSYEVQRYNFPTGEASSFYTYRYGAGALDLTSETLLLFDQVLQQKILLTNLTSSSLRIVVFDKDYKIKKHVRLPLKSDISPYQFQMLEFYPTKADGDVIYPGSIIIKTVRGNIVMDLQTLSTQFLIYSKFLFDDAVEEIPIKEIKKI